MQTQQLSEIVRVSVNKNKGLSQAEKTMYLDQSVLDGLRDNPEIIRGLRCTVTLNPTDEIGYRFQYAFDISFLDAIGAKIYTISGLNSTKYILNINNNEFSCNIIGYPRYISTYENLIMRLKLYP
ncbi:hypothetical protein HZA96_03075 [Candidatus Woesearchaeota archaeon]|nr:hypothetical protein [Candidatus Woesearchaeota archaeon]